MRSLLFLLVLITIASQAHVRAGGKRSTIANEIAARMSAPRRGQIPDIALASQLCDEIGREVLNLDAAGFAARSQGLCI